MGITGKSLLLSHVEHTFEKEAYFYTSLALAVRGLTAAQAAWKPSPARHSIWQIVRHVTHWKEAAVSALDGKPLDYDERNQSDWQEVAGEQGDWEADIARLTAISSEIRRRLEDMDEEALARGIRWYRQSPRPTPIAIRLLQLATHDIYHTGQIQYLFALQEIPVEELAAAASRNDLPRLERLLQTDHSMINDYIRDGWTALHVACFFSQEEAVRFLLASGADPNLVSRNETANTPLHQAVAGVGDRKAIARLLLQRGAEVATRDAAGRTPLDVVREEGDADLARLLQPTR